MPFNNFNLPSIIDAFRRRGGMGMNPFNSDSPDDSVDYSQDPQMQAPDFASQWKKIAGNTPNFNRLQQLVTQGAPVVQPTKMNRLGAILAASGAGMEDPARGIVLGQKLLQDPQDRATETYQSQVKNLGGLANMESDQMQKELEGLKFNEDLYFKNAADRRAETGLKYEGERTAADVKSSDANVARTKAETEKLNWEPYVDSETGMKMERNLTDNTVRQIGKVADTSEEKLADFRKQKQAEVDIAAPEKRKEEQAITNREMALEAARARDAMALSTANNSAKAQRQTAALKSKAAALKPGDAAKQVYNDLADAISSDPTLANINLDQYITADPTTKIMRVKPDDPGSIIGDGPEDLAIKAKLRDILGNAYSKAGSGGKAGGPGVKPPPTGFSIRPSGRGPG